VADVSPSGARRRGAGVRTRITLGATAVVAVALLLGAIVFWATLRLSLLDGLSASAEQDAEVIASQLEEGGPAALGELDDDRFVQVVDDSGVVVAASENAPTSPVTARSGEDPGTVSVDGEVFVTAIDDADGGFIVIAGRSTEPTDETLATVAGLLAIAVPLLIVVVAVTTWFVVGRALSPVERMRRQVDAVTSTTLARRLDETGTDDEIGRLARTMNGMLDRLEASQATQRRFISDASHELKSPLAALRQYAEVARDHPERISGQELGDVVLEEGGRLERLVQGMLVLARADEGALHLELIDVDLDDLLIDEARRVRGAAVLSVDTSGIAAARVRGDLGLLRQLVRNLVDNAVRHAHGLIALTAGPGPDGASAMLTVCDDGDGIPAADRERVFDRFVRLDDARARDTGGSGLGLAIVREIALAHGGSVRIEDATGQGGTCVRVTLPAGG
jgi:signal transduction histidine kinase